MSTIRPRSFTIFALILPGLLVVGGGHTQRVSAQASAPAAPSQTTGGTRRIPLQGVANFRDLGGYATTDGRHVRWRKIYRSGELSRLTVADYEILNRLNISVVCDFRRDSERNAAPTKWQGSGATSPDILNVPGAQTERSAGGGGTRSASGSAATGQPQLSQLLVTSYPTYPANLATSFKTVLQQLMTRDGAVLYHCTAGKDRTGTFSALLLTLLGVPRDTVMSDYLLSNEFVATPARIDAFVARGGTRESAVAQIGVDRVYLDLMFKALEAEYGSLDNYRRTALGLSDADLAALKQRLLE